MNHAIINRKMSKPTLDVMAFLSKWGAFVGYVTIGIIGKLGYDIVSKKRLTFWYVFGTGCVAYCVGFFSWEWCRVHPTLNPGIIVPFASLVSRDIMLFLTVIDWKGVLSLLTGKGTKNK